MNRGRTFALLASLYVSQYLGIGFFYTALVAILRERGAPLEQLGAVQVIGFVWGLKFLWAPLLDRYGSYRGWLLALQPAIVVGLLAVAPLDPMADFPTLLLLAGAVAALSATQDVAADAIAVRLLAGADRGIGNGIQVAGGYLGNLIGGGAVLLVYDAAGWGAAICVLAVLAALPIVQVVRFREPPRADAARPGLRALVSLFRVPGAARWALLVMPLLWIGASGSYALITPMLVDAGWSLTGVGLLTTVGAGACAMLAAPVGGAIVARLGRRPALVLFTGVQLVAVLGLLPLALGVAQPIVAAAAVCLMFAAYAATSTVVNTVNMDLSRPASAGTDFTLLTCVAFLIAVVSGGGALAVAGGIGYAPTLVAVAALLAPAAVVAAMLFPHLVTAAGRPHTQFQGTAELSRSRRESPRR